MFFNFHLKTVLNKKNISQYIIFAGMPALVFYWVSLLVLQISGFQIIEILRDPAQQSGQSSFSGFLSNVGVGLWLSSAAICFFSITVHKSGLYSKHRELLFFIGMFSLVLAIDDFFMIHDRYVDQNICYFIYAIIAGTLLIGHFNRIMEIDGFVFFLAGLLLALSVLTDLLQDYLPLSYAHTQVFEEGFKFMGAATWLYFSCRTGAFVLNQNIKANK